VAYLVRTSRLTHSEAVRIVGDVLSFLDERPEEFVIQRHHALQGEGLPNGGGCNRGVRWSLLVRFLPPQ
jgi:hypothetical protein